MHCANHCLDLVWQEVAKEEPIVADAMQFVRSVTTILRDSNKRMQLFESLFTTKDPIRLSKLTANGALYLIGILKYQIEDMQTDEHFNQLFLSMETSFSTVMPSDPQEKRKCKTPAKYRNGTPSNVEPLTTEVNWKRQYFAVIDRIFGKIHRRFDHSGIQVLSAREQNT